MIWLAGSLGMPRLHVEPLEPIKLLDSDGKEPHIFTQNPLDLCFDMKSPCFGSKTGVKQVLGIDIPNLN